MEVTDQLDGFVNGQELVINRARINTPTTVGLLAAHEILGHVGMRARYGKNLDQVLDRFFVRMGGLSGVIAAGARHGLSLPDQYPELVNRARTSNNAQARRAMVQEVFAAATEANYLARNEPTLATGIQDFVSRVKGFLARFPGLGQLFDTFTDQDIMRVVRDSSKAALRSTSVAPIDAAASVGGVLNRLAGVGRGDRVFYAADGTTTVVKAEVSGRTAEGDTVRNPNEVVDLTDPWEATTAKAKQTAAMAWGSVLGSLGNQVKPSTDPLRRGPDAGRTRKGLANSSFLQKSIEFLADSREGMRRVTRDLSKYLNSDDRALSSMGLRMQQGLYNVLAEGKGSTQSDAFKPSEQALLDQFAGDVARDFNTSINSAVKSHFSDAMSTHSKAIRASGLAVESVRDQIVDMDIDIDEAAIATGALIGRSAEDAMEGASAIATALTAIEKNNADFYRSAELKPQGELARKRLMDRYESINAEGTSLPEAEGARMYEQLKTIVNENFLGPDVEAARLSTSTAGMTTAIAQDALAKTGVTADNLGPYAGMFIAMDKMQAHTRKQRAAFLPQAFFNERALFGFKHDYPVETTNLAKFPLYANAFTQRGAADFTSETERKSQLTDNAVLNVRTQAVLAAQAQFWNSETMRALAMNVLATRTSEQHNSVTNGYYNTKEFRLISKNDKEFREYASNALEGVAAKHTFMYSVPGSEAVIVMKFDELSSTPGTIRGERSLEEWRQTTAMKAIRVGTGGMSRMMTRNNVNFIPRSHVREHLIAGAYIGADQGLGAAKEFLSRSLDNNSHANEVYRYMRLRNTRTREAEVARKEMLRTSATARDLQDLISQSGLVTQLASLSEPGQAEISRRTTGNLVNKSMTGFDNWFGSLTDTTDAIVRLSAYQASLHAGKSKQEAATYAKRLANFEARGKVSGIVGDLLMFYNPSAIGASRLIESLTEGEYARPATMAAFGAGMALHFLLAEFSDEDENGKKLFDSENMDRQTTDIRIPLSDKTTLGIPAGFSAMSIGFLLGNQMAGFLRGRQDMSQLAANSYEVMLSNFSPVPASGIPIVNSEGNLQFGKYISDTFTPSVVKPIAQYMANMNGLGLPIYKTGNANSAGGLTDAFNGRESDVGTWAERLAVAMHELTGGGIDKNPGVLRHYMSSYLNGINAVLDFGAEAYNMTDGLEAGHNFVDRSLGFGGFFSKTGHRDDYYSTRRVVNAISKQIKTYESVGQLALAKLTRDKLPPNFDELVIEINKNKRAQDMVNTEMRPIIYGQGSQGEKQSAIDLQNERRRQLQAEGILLMNQIVKPNG